MSDLTTVRSDVMDVATFIQCLLSLEKAETSLKFDGWKGINAEQKTFLHWCRQFGKGMPQLKGMQSLASKNWKDLNTFLEEQRCPPRFTYFSPTYSIGAATVLRLLVKWAGGMAKVCPLQARDGNSYPGFIIPRAGARISVTKSGHLARLATESGDYLYLSLPKSEVDLPTGLDLVSTAIKLTAGDWNPDCDHAGVHLPKVDLAVQPDTKFLLGMSNGVWAVTQTFQDAAFRMNEHGAAGRVSSGMTTTRGGPLKPLPLLVFDRPFLGWLTQADLPELPLLVFSAGYECWREPAGSLEDL